MSQFESGGFDDFAPPPRGGYGAPPPGRGPPPGAYGAPPPRHYGGSGNMTAGIPRVGAAHAGQRFGGGGGLRPSAPTWVPDASVTGCSSARCGTQFDTFERRHHCRYCGLVFCGKCTEATSLMPPQWEGGCGFSTRDPQRVCGQCRLELEPHQRKWIEQNCNANRTNALDLNDSTTRYLNSPLRFTLGGEVRKAGYALKNLTDGVNVWDRDLEYFDQQLQGADGLLFLTVAKVAFISGIRVGTGLVVARLPDGSWSAPCAVGSSGFTFGAVVGAEITDMITAMDAQALAELYDAQTTKLTFGGEASFAFGPLGRTATGEAMVATDASTATATAYSQSRGFYGGVTVDASHLRVRDDVNLKFYGKPVSAADLLRGAERQPTAAAPLYEQLHAFYSTMNARLAAATATNAPSYAAGGQPPRQPPPSYGQQYEQQPPPQQQYQQQPQQYQQPAAAASSTWSAPSWSTPQSQQSTNAWGGAAQPAKPASGGGGFDDIFGPPKPAAGGAADAGVVEV